MAIPEQSEQLTPEEGKRAKGSRGCRRFLLMAVALFVVVNVYAIFTTATAPRQSASSSASPPATTGARNLFAPDLPRHHITGCNEAGELEVPVVNVWREPGGVSRTNRAVGKLSGNGRADQGLSCQGAVVVVLESRQVEGRTFYHVASIVRGDDGWVSDSFIGREFDPMSCSKHFTELDHLRRCTGD